MLVVQSYRPKTDVDMTVKLPKKRINLFMTEPGAKQSQFTLPEGLAKMTNRRNYQQPYSCSIPLCFGQLFLFS